MNIGKKKINCPFCKKEFEADFYTVVRGDIDLELKEMIINNEFELLMCPECGKIFNYEETFIYIDPVYQIMAFVLPSNTENKEELISKLEKDYELIKEGLLKEKSLNFKPIYFFGIDGLSELLIKDRDNEEETEVITFIAESMGFKSRRINPSFAREHNLPFLIPVKDKNSDKKEVLEICKKIFSENDALKRLGNFIELFDNKDLEIPFIEDL